MKKKTFNVDPYYPAVEDDVKDYMATTGDRIGSAPTRHYMQHRNQTGYTRIRQTKTQIIVEWME